MNKDSKRLLFRVGITASIPLIGMLFVLTYPYMTGERLTDKKRYETHCGNCHGKNGEGLRNLYPPLAGSDYLEKNRSKIPCIIRNGLNEPIKVNGKMFDQPMPEMSFLNSRQITGIINFINISWGNDQKEWKQGEVDFVLRKCAVKPEKEP